MSVKASVIQPAPSGTYAVTTWAIWSEIDGVVQPTRPAQGLSKALSMADTLIGEKLWDVMISEDEADRDQVSRLVNSYLTLARRSFRPAAGSLYFIFNNLRVHIAPLKLNAQS